MRPAASEEQEEILEFAYKDLGNCLYIYMDILQYGIGSALKVWRNARGNLRTIIMRYHDSLQIYSTGLKDEKETFLHIINQEKVRMISCPKFLVPIMEKSEGEYKKSYGLIYEIKQIPRFNRPEGFAIAEEKDLGEMAAFVCENNEVGAHYTVEDLTEQYIERYQMGMGRNYYVRKDGILQAHIATYAENELVAITAGLYAREDAYPFWCGSILENCLINDLLNEGKRVFTFVTTPKRKKYFSIMEAQNCGEYVKIVRL